MIFQVEGHLRKRKDTYKVSITDKGWNIKNLTIGGECDESGSPYLFKNFEQDDIKYPNHFGTFFSYLWDEAKKKNLSEEEIQSHLDELSKWLNTFQESYPQGNFWIGYR
mgnify:CR=1 FL=1